MLGLAPIGSQAWGDGPHSMQQAVTSARGIATTRANDTMLTARKVTAVAIATALARDKTIFVARGIATEVGRNTATTARRSSAVGKAGATAVMGSKPVSLHLGMIRHVTHVPDARRPAIDTTGTTRRKLRGAQPKALLWIDEDGNPIHWTNEDGVPLLWSAS